MLYQDTKFRQNRRGPLLLGKNFYDLRTRGLDVGLNRLDHHNLHVVINLCTRGVNRSPNFGSPRIVQFQFGLWTNSPNFLGQYLNKSILKIHAISNIISLRHLYNLKYVLMPIPI